MVPPMMSSPTGNNNGSKKKNESLTIGETTAENGGSQAGGTGVAVVSIGPDLNPTRRPLDKKLYRQILLSNGLRVLLIEDLLAIHDNDHNNNDATSLNHHAHVEEEEESDQGSMQQSDVEDEDEEESFEDDDDDEEDSGLRDAAACLLVGAGSMHEPNECQGLAHFLEHLLFMGSEKYRGENDYEAFIAKHGGSDNAWTEWECTTYSFVIPQHGLWGALDRLAQFFIAPLMLPSAVDRELLSIESEFQLNKNSDTCRWQQLLSATSKPNHPMAKFSWGNLRSLREIPAELGIDPMKELWKFYNRYYYAANMRLVVVGAYTLDHLQEKVVEMFSPVPALPREQGDFPLPVDTEEITSWDATYTSPFASMGSPLQSDSLGKLFRIIPVKDKHTLSITWPIPPVMDQWSSKPCDYIAHLMGHEAAGSLLSYFRSRSWAVSCVVGVGEEGSERASSHALFVASFVLSEEGLKEWRSMVAAVYQYIGMLRLYCRGGWPEWIYEELRNTQALSYHYEDEPSPDDLVEDIAEDMAPHNKLPPERLLDGLALLFEFDAVAVQTILDEYLTPANARIDLTSSFFGRPSDYPDGTAKEGTETLIRGLNFVEESDSFDPVQAGRPESEPMFGTLFWSSSLPQSWLKEWSDLCMPQQPSLPISLPQQNPFVPTKLDLKKLPDDDSHHPLLRCSLKLCILVGKTKQWFPATAIKYNRKKNALLMSYEDEHEQWHTLDEKLSDMTNEMIVRDFEGTLDKKAIKFRVLSTAGAGRKYGDESDVDVEVGTFFPPIPPALPESRLPKQISNTNELKMWWLQDRHFHRPIAELRLQVICANANKTPLHRACADLLESLCADALLETSYLASVCDLSFAISSTDVGFNISFDGFDDKLLDLFQNAMEVFLSFCGQDSGLPSTIKNDRFAACLEVLQRKYKNTGMQAPKLASNIRLQALRTTIWSSNQKMQALSGIDIPSFANTASSLLDGYAIEALYHGNVDRSDADKAKDLILSMVRSARGAGLSRKKYPSQSVLRIPKVSTPTLITVPSKDPSEPNTAVEVYVQVNKDNLRERVLIDLLMHMMDEPIFDQLRTKDQFGYDVSCDVRWSYGIMGMVLHVVTNVKSAQEVVERIDRFLIEYANELETLSHDDFVEHLVGLANQKLDMFDSLSEETNSYWGEIRDGRFEWQSWRNEVVCLRTLRKEDILTAYDKWLNPVTRRNILAVQVIGAGGGEASIARPVVEGDDLGSFFDDQVQAFHKICKKQTWGRVNSKLF